MLTIEQVADHVLELSPYGGFSNRELQKILYFAQGFHLAQFGEPLFSETLYAWEYGPVNTTIWHKFKGYGYNLIGGPGKEKLAPVSDDVAKFLSTVVLALAVVGQGKLIEFSHADTPWASTYIPQANRVLDKDSLRNYFGSFTSIEEYLAEARQKLAFHELVAQRLDYLKGLPELGDDWISGRSVAPSEKVCDGARRFVAGLERFIFASGPKPDVPKMLLGPIPSGGVGLEFKNTKVSLYLHLHNDDLVEFDVEKEGHFESQEFSFTEFDEDFTPYYKVLV
jgi:uncharacterized phage-associated protein